MIEEMTIFMGDVAAWILVSFQLLACLIVATGFGFLVKEIREHPWRKRCEEMQEERRERIARANLLGEHLASKTLRRPETDLVSDGQGNYRGRL